MNFKSIFISIALALAGCGQQEGSCPDTVADQNTYADAGDCQHQGSAAQPEVAGVTIRGSISAAFGIEVDGTAYPDSEAYFAAAMSDLRSKADKAGYEDYDVKLSAVVGFNDLTNGMTVYVQAMSNRGYQGTTTIGRDNNFSLPLPPDASGDYQIRANKRVTMELTADGEKPVMFCYNLSANAVSVPFDVTDKPVILRSFSTTLTKYACEANEVKPTLAIPESPKMGGSEPNLGETQEDEMTEETPADEEEQEVTVDVSDETT